MAGEAFAAQRNRDGVGAERGPAHEDGAGQRPQRADGERQQEARGNREQSRKRHRAALRPMIRQLSDRVIERQAADDGEGGELAGIGERQTVPQREHGEEGAKDRIEQRRREGAEKHKGRLGEQGHET
jgi:hypothetical protein